MKKINLIFLILFGLINKISSLLRRLHKGEEKCIFNDFFVKSNIIITLNISESDINYKSEIKSPLFAISIYNKKNNKLIKKYETSKSNTKFSFNVEKTGHYKTCIISYIDKIIIVLSYIFIYLFNPLNNSEKMLKATTLIIFFLIKRELLLCEIIIINIIIVY